MPRSAGWSVPSTMSNVLRKQLTFQGVWLVFSTAHMILCHHCGKIARIAFARLSEKTAIMYVMHDHASDRADLGACRILVQAAGFSAVPCKRAVLLHAACSMHYEIRSAGPHEQLHVRMSNRSTRHTTGTAKLARR
eukprot:6175255-Pleurochrysis_carterae.AAC.1